ncbi:hypothetical protein BDR22DRAFT_820731 [Usnea florida]
MPNVGGRSNGCITCLRRRVRCDRGEPSCGNCRNGGIPCEGYRGLPITFDPHQRLIQNGTPTTVTPRHGENEADEGFVMIDHNMTSSAEPSALNASSSNHNGITTVITRPPRGRPRRNNLPAVKKPTTATAWQDPSLLLPFEMSLAAFKEPVCVTFLVQNFLGHLDTGNKSLLPAWDVNNVSGTARDSVHALALAFFGKAHHDENIVHQGAECYGKALLKLAHDLNDNGLRRSPSVLLSSILLARYELVASTGSRGWIQHAGGVERLFEVRGPKSHQSIEERHIFEAARPIIVIKAITDEKRTFLDREEWLTLPWGNEQKSPMNLLIDIFCVIPGLLEDCKTLSPNRSFIWDYSPATIPSTDSAESQDPRLADLRQRVQECYTKLERWKEEWSMAFPLAVQIVKNMTYFPRSELKFPIHVFQHAITFPNFLRANEYQLYNTVVFFLSSLMLSLPPSSSNEYTALPSVSDLLDQRWQAAYDICRAVPYDLMFEKHGCGGAYLLLFPLLTNLRLFGADSEEGKWIKQVLEGIRAKWGLEGERKYMAI